MVDFCGYCSGAGNGSGTSLTKRDSHDFIDDYGATKKGRVYIDEVEQLRKLLDNLEQKCKRD